jgi:hypothetical protein
MGGQHQNALLAPLGGEHLVAVGIQNSLDHTQNISVILHNKDLIFII